VLTTSLSILLRQIAERYAGSSGSVMKNKAVAREPFRAAGHCLNRTNPPFFHFGRPQNSGFIGYHCYGDLSVEISPPPAAWSIKGGEAAAL
jgi:hypothetical protein